MSILFHCQGDDNGRMLQALREALPDHEIKLWPDASNPEAIKHAVVWMPPENFFDGLVNLEHVHAVAAGVDQLLTHKGLPPEVNIYRLEDAGMGVKMCEYVLYGVLHAHRRLPALLQAQRDGRWAREIRTVPASNWHVGILGAGVLGSLVASRLVANGYSCCCWSRSPRELPKGVEGMSGAESLGAFLKPCNVLVCLLPLTDQTRGILDAELFSQLQHGAFLINPGRGEHLVERELSAALDSGQLSGALLDVFATEPLPEIHAFWNDPRILITPHLAAPSSIEGSISRISKTILALDGSSSEIQTARVERSRGY